MKKSVVAIFLAVLMFTMSAFANSALPSFLTDIPLNYTEDCSVSITFDSSEDVVALLRELELPEEVEYYVDTEALIKSLLSYDGKMFLQVDMSENFDKIKLALTTESDHNIYFNQNAQASAKLKIGLWLNIDLSDDKKPVFDMILSYPVFNKYLKITSDDVFVDETAYGAMKAVFNKEYIGYIQELSVKTLMEYADVSGSKNEYTIRMDNEALCAYIDRIIVDMAQITMPTFIGDDSPFLEFPAVKDWKILGDDGMTCVYKLKGGKLSAEKVSVDVSADISEIYTALTGGNWMYGSKGILNFTVDIEASMSKYGSTKVEFPVLNAENSISMKDIAPEYNAEVKVEFEKYPNWHIYGESKQLPVINGKMYMPLRDVLTQAYKDTISISYSNGAVTAVCDYFPGYSELVAVIDSPVAYANGAQHVVSAPIALDGTVYVNGDFLADMLGFSLCEARYDYINELYIYELFAY